MSTGTNESPYDDRFAEPWPAWRGPDPYEKGAVEPRPSVPMPTGPTPTGPMPATSSAGDADAAFELENLRAAVAQGSALVPFLGPLIAFLANGRYSFARREAAKAFNGQAITLLLMFASAWFAYYWWMVWIAILVGWVLHVIIAIVMANCGRDWLSIWNRAVHLQILPEGEQDPVRSRKRRRRRQRRER